MIGLDDKPGWNPSAANGGFSGSVTLTAEQVGFLFAGRLYINVHTPTNGGGEIRGNLVQPPFDAANPDSRAHSARTASRSSCSRSRAGLERRSCSSRHQTARIGNSLSSSEALFA